MCERRVRLLRRIELSRGTGVQHGDEEVHDRVFEHAAMQWRVLLERDERHMPAWRHEHGVRRGRRDVHELHGGQRWTDVHDEWRWQQSVRLLGPDRLQRDPGVQSRRGPKLQVVLPSDRLLLQHQQQRML